ncbi:MAG: hypothetical protein JXB47_07510 [Anaerolineae bacterium]|nr:hypothetical protein [Anaerolineae bacterium]
MARYTKKTQHYEEEIVAIRIQKTYLRRRMTVEQDTPDDLDCFDDDLPVIIEGQTVPILPPQTPALPMPGFDFGVTDPPVDLFDLLDRVGSLAPLTAVVGATDDDRPLLVRLEAPNVGNILIAGQEGAGKSTLLRSMLLGLALTNPPAQMQIVLIDPLGGALGPLDSLPHRLAPLAVQPVDIDNLLTWLVREAQARHQVNPPRKRPAVIVAVNTPSSLASTVGAGARDSLVVLAQYGPAAGIHLLCSETYPGRLPQALQERFSVRLVGRVASAQTAQHAAGVPGTGAERLSGGGDFLAVAGVDMTSFWGAAYSAADAARAIASLTQTPARSASAARLLP